MEQGIIMTFIIGLVVGVIAKLLKPGKDPGGFIITALIGIAGAFIAKYIGQAVGWYRPDESAGFIASVIGAIVLLVIYGMATRKR
ncbi:MAG: GlsB/YeaQ/YmgE family stress response membrane protein [Dokdonella sp.]